MSLDPRTPVVVGVAQTLRRPGDLTAATEPVEMMVDALRLAAADSGAGDGLLARADSVQVPKVVSWSYLDPGALVAARLGIAPAETVYCTDGGNTPQRLVNDAAEAILRGERDVVLLAGAEATWTRLEARKRRAWLEWPKQVAGWPTRFVGELKPGVNEQERAAGLELPIHIYPLFENALAAANGVDPVAHRASVAQLWSRFSAVAAGNPHAWSPRAFGADEIASPTAENRMVAWPYTKLMCANSATDQAAAVIVCSVEAARAAGVPSDRWVFPWSAADAHDHWYLSERANLHSSPALRVAGRAALELSGLGIDDPAHLDLYACFPSAVQVAAAELGLRLDGDRPLTVTGGNAFAGAPGNNFGMHAIAAMVATLRADPTTTGLVTGVGWYLTKHAVGVYGAAPPPGPFRRRELRAWAQAPPRREPLAHYSGQVEVESFTVLYDRDATAAAGVVAGLTPSGNRVWGRCTDPTTLRVLLDEAVVGSSAHRDVDGIVKLA
jgi:acetyl-CoA C-acetyltransferase